MGIPQIYSQRRYKRRVFKNFSKNKKRSNDSLKTYTYPATFQKVESKYIVSFPDFDYESECGENISDACKAAENILSDLISDKLEHKEVLPDAYSDEEKLRRKIITKVTVHIPELTDACRIISRELAKKEFFYSAFVSTVRSAINDTLNKLDKDTDTILVDDIAEAVVDRIGGIE